MMVKLPEELKFDEKGLIPAIVQDAASGRVLMLAYMNEEALARTLATGQTWFYSRSRRELWHKGATSGHYQYVEAIFYDCDADALLIKARQEGVACHEGEFSCFHHVLWAGPNKDGAGRAEGGRNGEGRQAVRENAASDLGPVLQGIFQVIKSRQAERPEGSYTAYLFNSGQDKILKKIGEEATEVVMASKNNNQAEILYELADLYYHTLVVLAYHGLTPGQLAAELDKRRK
ncbi:MAG: phosphoribosyl-AMP cyclohydrolase / phosphoribosyl-ATP pyrophosphohydrolase [Clostridia bacterium]|nr:phosphoribosyl-AMP cyclohydrolase / phosphoribosyl-ATP pyrophosphohydrolase [Clostridia bacterium]